MTSPASPQSPNSDPSAAARPDADTSAGSAPRGSSSSGLLITGIAVMVVALLAAVVAVIGLLMSGSGLVDAFRADPITTPGSAELSLSPATYSVLQLSDGEAYRIAIDDIAVTRAGDVVSVSEPTVTETLDRNGKVYESIAQFRVTQEGSYTVAIASDGPAEVIISQSIGSTITRSVVWFGLLGFAGFLGLVGLGLLVFAIVRRSMRRTAARQATITPAPLPMTPAAPQPQPTPVAVAAAQAPAGWYADPERPGGQRYWDGTAWTEHRT